jgi:site-specific recombinase XerD
MKALDFSDYLLSYLTKYMPLHQGSSENTIKSYRDSFILWIRFCNEVLNIPPEKVVMKTLSRTNIEQYLLWLEKSRSCGVNTRNHRLTVIQTFLRYVSLENPEYLPLLNATLEIKCKKAPTKPVQYLNLDELQRIFAQPNTDTSHGKRDLALLSLLYDTGARVSEIINLKLCDVRLTKPATVILNGKGGKPRVVPITGNVIRILNNYVTSLSSLVSDDYFFVNSKGEKLTRSGVEFILSKYAKEANVRSISPHVLRHSKAMHLVQAGVNIIYIRDFLGHSSVQTTEIYAKADSESKRKALEQAGLSIVPKSKFSNAKRSELMTWLKELV